MRKLLTMVLWTTVVTVGVAQAAPREEPRGGEWPTLREQLARAHAQHGTALEQLVTENQDFALLDRGEAHDRIPVPLWLRVHWRKAHPEGDYSPRNPTHGYPLVLKEVAEWMQTHQNFDASAVEPELEGKTFAGGANVRLSGAQTNPRSESDIRVNYWNTSKVIGASNNIGGSGQQAQWSSSDGGSSWTQSYLPLATGDSFHSDPTVEWTSDGTAWSTTIGIDSTGNVLKMRAYKSTDGGVTWALDNTFSGSQTAADKQMIWVDHSATSAYKDTLYAIWHNNNPVQFNRRRAGSWLASPVQISGSETTGTGIGADIKTNASGDLFAAWPDTGSSKIWLRKSTDGGSTWGTAVALATTYDTYDIGVPAFSSRRMLVYVALGAYRTSSKNNVYAVWNDLSGATGCTAPANEPGTSTTSTCKTRIWFAKSTDGGATWTKRKINDQSSLNDQFNPWLVVDETNGKVAVMYYDTVNDPNRKKVDVFYQSSSDDGTTFTAPLKVTTAMTDETSTGADSGNQFGDYNSLSGYSGGFFPSWTDRRSGGKEEIWSAKVTDDGGATNSPPTASFTFTTSGLTATFSNTSTDSDGTIASSSWNFGDGTTSTATSPSHTYTAGGTYTVSLTVTDNGGASNSTSHGVSVASTCTPPAAPTGVTASSSSTSGATVSWAASSGATSYSILRSTTSGGPYTAVGTSTTTSFADSGLACNTTYYYVVTASNGSCASGNSAQASATTAACPVASLTNGTFETGALAPWTSAGTATVSTSAKHAGTYGAMLGSTAATNGDSSISQTFTVPSGASTLSFYYRVVCPDTVTYDWATATLKDNTAGTTTTMLAKTCTNSGAWAQASTSVSAMVGHSVTLTLTSHDDNYASDPTYTYYDDVTIATGTTNNPPVASFTSTTSGLTATFTNTSTDSDGSIAASSWSFGDGTTSTATSPSHTYAAGGTYTVTLTVTDNAGATNSKSGSVTVSSGVVNPFANPGFETGTLGSWTPAGASTSVSSTTKHAGTYAAMLGSTAATNGDSSISQTVTMPAGSSKVTFWYLVVCPDTVTYDWATATLKDNTTGTTTTVLAKTCTNNSTWVQVSVAATAGHSVTLTVTSHDDNYSSDPTRTFVDDVNVQ